MNLSNAARSQLSRVPGVNRAIDFLCARANTVWSVEHDPDTGVHTDITADSLRLTEDLRDPLFTGNVSSSLIPTEDGLNLGGLLSSASGSPDKDHPWRDLRLSGTIYIGAAWEETVTNGIPLINRGVNELVIDVQGQPDGLMLTGITAGTVQMANGYFDYDGIISADSGFLERSRSALMGEWTDVAYNAANFTASAGTWTVDSGDQTTYAYTLVGKTMTVAFFISGTDVSSAASLRIAIPGGLTAAKAMRNPIQVIDAATYAVGFAAVAASGTIIECFASIAGTTFGVTAADDTAVIGQITFEVQ